MAFRLRFYDKIGLFQPAIKDPENRYRYYSIEQFWYFDIITCFRKLGCSLEMIKEILSYKDNAHIVNVLRHQRQEAQKMRDYYAGILEDIDWYCEQNQRIKNYGHVGKIHIVNMPARRVIYGINSSGRRDYHIHLQENSREEVLHTNSIKRNYGYLLNPEYIRANRFDVQGSYVSMGNGSYPYTSPEHIMTLPSGRYACFITNVCGREADFSSLVRWMDETGQSIRFIIADEVGLQLFYYNQYEYPCEIKAYLGSSDVN